MSNGNGHHWSKFFWRDWSADKALHPCSLAAKGFWIEMLCIMHEGQPVGHLTLAGKPASIRQMAANAYCSEKEATRFLAELEEAGVFSRTDKGVIFCRRMVKDAAASDAGREHIQKRWNAHQPNSPPNRGPISKPNGGANSDPITKKLEAEAEAREPPRSPPVNRGGARRGNFRNAAHEMAREMDAQQPITIDGTVGTQIVDFLEFTGARPKQAGGANG